MTYMLCRNKLIDFAKWKRGLDSHADAHKAAGLTLQHLWQNVNDPNEVFFLFAVELFDPEAQLFHDVFLRIPTGMGGG